jgi:hypothetical protein
MAFVKWKAGPFLVGDTKPPSIPWCMKTKFAKPVGGHGFCGADPFSFRLTIFAPATFVCVDESVLTTVVRFFWRVRLGIVNFVAMFTLKLTSC